MKCSYKVVQKLSKVVQKLSNRSQKNPKKSKKIRKNPIFSLFFLWSRLTFYKKSLHHLSYKTVKKMLKKKVEKKVVFIFTNFFFKIHFGHFFMSNFKIKKKVLKTSSFSIFRWFKNYHSSPEKRYFMFFLWNSHFQGNFR